MIVHRVSKISENRIRDFSSVGRPDMVAKMLGSGKHKYGKENIAAMVWGLEQ